MSRRIVYSKEMLEPIVANSLSIREVCKKIGLLGDGSINTYIRKRIDELGIDRSHFKGRYVASYKKLLFFNRSLPINEVLSIQVGGVKRNRRMLDRALRFIGRKYECDICGIGDKWNGTDLVLQIDHINGDSFDHRRENLRYLCPNCHSQTKNFCKKNINFKGR